MAHYRCHTLLCRSILHAAHAVQHHEHISLMPAGHPAATLCYPSMLQSDGRAFEWLAASMHATIANTAIGSKRVFGLDTHCTCYWPHLPFYQAIRRQRRPFCCRLEV